MKDLLILSLRWMLRGVGVVLLLFVAVAGSRAIFAAASVQAASDLYNPEYCLGGWGAPKAAAGAPQGQPYTADNSAVLEREVAAQLFCGYFGVEAGERPPQSARLSFAWRFDFPPPAAADVWELPSALLEVPAESTDAPAAASSETAAEAPAPVEPEPEVAPAEQAEAPVEASEPPAAPPVEAPGPLFPEAPAAPQSSVLLTRALALLFGPAERARAQENTFSMLDMLEVSYSFDGVHWHSAGKVNESNWQDFSVAIPAASWEELQSLQIMVAALPSLGSRPPVYLESVDLKVENDRTLLETAQDTAEAVSDTVSDALALADEVADSLVGLVLGAEDTAAKDAAPEAAPQQSLRFALGGEVVASGSLPPPQVEVGDDGRALRVSGACTLPYFVVLTYRNPEDYKRAPRSFASNYAGPCVGGGFSYQVEHLPQNTPPGTYYLLLAEQGEDGPWVPASALLPITIESPR